MITEERVNELLEKGFKRWTKGNMDRLYINAGQLGLVCQYYKSGNIRSAEFNGQSISNCEARRLQASKTFIDIKTGLIYSDNFTLEQAARKLAGLE
jgi:hypothetical protein